MSVTSAEFRQAMGCFATGVTVITVDFDGQVHGMTANAFTSVSLDPLGAGLSTIGAHSCAPSRQEAIWGECAGGRSTEYFGVLCARGPGSRSCGADAGARFDRTAHGTPVLNGALAYLECRLHTAQDAGDHTIFIAEVEEVVVRDGDPSALLPGTVQKYSRFRIGVIKCLCGAGALARGVWAAFGMLPDSRGRLSPR